MNKAANSIPSQIKSGARSSYIAEKGGCDNDMLRKKYAVRITDAVKKTIKGDITNDPVAKQYIPQMEELKIIPEEDVDPIGDDVHSPVKGLVHRYPDRVLLKLANVCAVYCRYCFRREQVGPGGDILDQKELESALSYIRENPAINEVILTGGDPLILSARKLDKVLGALEAIEHIKIIRIHSRIPIADPKRITAEMLKTLDRETPIYMVVHINHAQELSDQVQTTLREMHKAGCVLLSQSVLLKGVNNDPGILEDLFKALLAVRVKPYYIHHPDMAPGTSHFRLSLDEGVEIMRQLQGRMTGIAMPHYMLDIPGGYGKVPINADYVTALENEEWLVEDLKGMNHHYPPKGCV